MRDFIHWFKWVQERIFTSICGAIKSDVSFVLHNGTFRLAREDIVILIVKQGISPDIGISR
ncbi:hypothetical protein [Legionella bononiensis]|uniref:hypothetical protein n=1 Tax=Legionella bononiensis TaxID=2793102 RepID=UPI0019331667|nr:hypothetical protein [Legionella bononiensis]MBL7481282.1 hypothetical protein [Legionella bononiensis]